jgi:hypothetical protein
LVQPFAKRPSRTIPAKRIAIRTRPGERRRRGIRPFKRSALYADSTVRTHATVSVVSRAATRGS